MNEYRSRSRISCSSIIKHIQAIRAYCPLGTGRKTECFYIVACYEYNKKLKTAKSGITIPIC
jgi:hypothetical protein